LKSKIPGEIITRLHFQPQNPDIIIIEGIYKYRRGRKTFYQDKNGSMGYKIFLLYSDEEMKYSLKKEYQCIQYCDMAVQYFQNHN